MALVLANRVQETTTTTGTGTVTLAGAVAGFQSFAVIGNANTTYYTITSGNDWEVGIGTYTSSGTTLARTTVLSSSAGGTTKITLAGTSTVFVTYPSEEAILDGYGLLPVANGGTGVATSTGTGNVVLSTSPTLVTPVLGAASATSITAALGAVGTPSYTFTGDTNTGIFSPSADAIVFATGGVEAVRIDSSGNVTLSDKIIPNVQSVTSAATITPNANTDTQVSVTALAVPATIASPTGTASDGQSLVIRIEDNGTARALTWTTGSGAYRAVGITLPTTTVATKVVYIGCKYNSTDLRWDAIALSQEA
jgi:hypothetical protein